MVAGDGHEPEQCAEIIAGWLREDGFEVALENTTRAFADPAIRDVSLIVPIYTMSTIEKDEAANLVAAVQGGVGMGGHHGAMGDAFRHSASTSSCRRPVGRASRQHHRLPCRHVPARRSGHGGDRRVPLSSEQYHMHVDPSNEVLATTTFSSDQPTGSTARHAGRVEADVRRRARLLFRARPPATDSRPDMATILRRGMNWAAR